MSVETADKEPAEHRTLTAVSRREAHARAKTVERVRRTAEDQLGDEVSKPGAPAAPIRGQLYDAAAMDRQIEVTPEAVSQLQSGRILWIDLPRRDSDELSWLGQLLSLDKRTIEDLTTPRGALGVDNYGAYLQFAGLAAPGSADPRTARDRRTPDGDRRIDFLIGRNWVVTIHGTEVAYLEAFRAQDKGDTLTGALSAAALGASLLDWHLEEYFAEVSRIETAIDEVDEGILAEPSEDRLLEDILAIRRRSSRLRRALMVQRSVFYGLSRPDLGHGLDSDALAALAALASRFERAVDEAEHTRDLSVGSFELFTSRSAQQTNNLVKALTFFTVIIGTTAAVAGLFGMNFNPPFFQSGSGGFFAVTIALLTIGLSAWIIGRRRGWI
ncbi:MAG: CorA family divalent cation transporter [Pseudomonadota bacterium]